MRVAENVEMLEVKHGTSVYNLTLTWDDNHLVLFDTGVPGMTEAIKTEIKKTGHKMEDLTDIILTHQDVDHVGSCKEILKLAPKAKVYAYEVEVPFIDGSKTPTKLTGLLAKGDSLTEKEVGFKNMLSAGFKNSAVTIDEILTDGQVLDIAGGIEVIFTPGHTPGHASFLLKESKIIVAGDAANISDGQLIGSNPAMTFDMEQAQNSLEKIKSYDASGVIAYHSGFWKK